MKAHSIKTVISQDKSLTLKDLPFHSGEQVEVIVLSKRRSKSSENPYPLRGIAIRYDQPTEPVALDNWEVSQ